jgi:redox-sensitive bicupin YhaK (pirin superfamily)
MTHATFPPHPHAGFSAITYMFEDSENSILNRDSRGNEEHINPGDLHWSQTGKGLLHEETPLKDGLVCHGLQIFINLPKKLKSTEPKIHHLANVDIPRVRTFDGTVEIKVVTGQFNGAFSPVQTDWPTDLLQMKWLKDGGTKITLAPQQSALLINLAQTLTIDESQGSLFDLPKVASLAACNRGTEAMEFEVHASKGSDLVILRSQVIDEPAISHGPFVAADMDEMNQIMNRYRRGEFGNLLPREEE